MASTPYHRDGKYEAERFGRGDADLVYTCGQVIVNGKPWAQRPFLNEVESRAGTWGVTADTGRIYVNFGHLNPSEQQVEITTRRRIFSGSTVMHNLFANSPTDAKYGQGAYISIIRSSITCS